MVLLSVATMCLSFLHAPLQQTHSYFQQASAPPPAPQPSSPIPPNRWVPCCNDCMLHVHCRRVLLRAAFARINSMDQLCQLCLVSYRYSSTLQAICTSCLLKWSLLPVHCDGMGCQQFARAIHMCGLFSDLQCVVRDVCMLNHLMLACSSTLSSEVSAFVSVPSVLSNCESGGSSSSSRSSTGSPTTSPTSLGSPSSSFNPLSSSPPAPLNGASSPPSLVTTSRSPRPPGSPPYPPASLDSGPISGGNLASFQNALSGGAPPAGTSISDIPASNNQIGSIPSGSSSATPSTSGNSGNGLFPVADSSIG